MNLSGYSAVQLCKRGPAKQSLASQLFFVAHDELSIAPGKFKFQLGGSPKGHNGLRDLIKQLKTEEFHRMRVGIGRPADMLNTEIKGKSRPNSMSIADWCLSATTRDEVNLNTQLDSELVKGAWNYIEQQRIKALLQYHHPNTPEAEEK
jgi:peptidyl-tRNA hydrolase